MGFQPQRVQSRIVFVVNFFRIFANYILFVVVAIFDLVHDVKAVHGLC